MTMTENITVTHLTDQPQPDASGVDLVHVPAADVVIENNVRTAADLDPAFLASVKQHGVLLPTIGYRDVIGRIVVRDGQMRVLAAIEAGCDVPVFVTARDDNTAKRIAEQLVANERRTALSDGDRLVAYRQLEIEGLSVTAIARETGTKRDAVKQTLTVAKSDAAIAAVSSGQASFTQALIVAEFDGDTEAVSALYEAISEGYDVDELAHVAARLRRDRERAAEVDALVAELAAAGKRVVTDDDDYAPLSRFTGVGDDVIAYDDRTPITEDEHTECPGAAYEVRQYGDVVAVPVCATPDAHALRVGRRIGESTPVELKSDEDSAAEAEERKAARRLLVANNKAWDAADDVRREWIAGLLQRKNAPKDAARFLAVALTRHANTRYASGVVSARGLLGIESSGWDGDTLSQWVEQHPTKGLHMALAVVFAGFENTANREWWRTPDADSRGYLGQLAAWGYPLSPVEKIAAGIQAEPTDQDAAAE